MKKFSVKTVVAIGIGAALFFVLGKIAIPSFSGEYQHQLTVCNPCNVCYPVWTDCRSTDRIYRTYPDRCYKLWSLVELDHCIRSGRCDQLVCRPVRA